MRLCYTVEYTRPDGTTGSVAGMQDERSAREMVRYYETDEQCKGYKARISALDAGCVVCMEKGGRWHGRAPKAVRNLGLKRAPYWIECVQCGGRGLIPMAV